MCLMIGLHGQISATTCVYRDFLPKLSQMLTTNQSIRFQVLNYIAYLIYSLAKYSCHQEKAFRLCRSRFSRGWSLPYLPLGERIDAQCACPLCCPLLCPCPRPKLPKRREQAAGL